MQTKVKSLPKKEIITEVDGRRLKLTNLQKVLFPSVGIMKAEIINYYINSAPYILKFINQRPLTLIRFPDGITANKFYSKNKPNWTPQWVASVKIDQEDDITYIMANEPATLAWTANLASLELHPMQIRANHLKYADHFIFDLDPPESADFEVVKQLAMKLKPFLEGYGYHPFIKTSGSKGLHIYVPITPQYDNATLLKSVKSLAKSYIKNDPSVTLKMSKEKRKGKVLLDIYRNHRSQTCVAPYSTRAKSGAPVSTPISWDELSDLESSRAFDIYTVLERLEAGVDPWDTFFDHAVQLHDHADMSKKKLAEYAKKRDFKKTPEPVDSSTPSNVSNNRYVIQLHDSSNLHYDLRIEDEGVLRSWAIPKGLPTKMGIKRLAIETEPHPIKYLTFEGVIPKTEYGGGEMWIFDTGEYEYIKKDAKKIKIKLSKGKIKGTFTLINTRDSQWLVETDIEESGIKSMKGTSPMLASMGEKIPQNASYFHEIKWDGIRVLIEKKGKYVKITSRNGNDLTEKFPKIVESFSSQEPQEIIADGEIVALNPNGTPNFSKVVGRMHLTGKDTIRKASIKTQTVFYAFDCIYLDGLSIMHLPIERRRKWLQVNIKVEEYVRFSQAFDDGEQLFQAIKAQGMEGIMSKLKGSKYDAGNRSKSWLKIKVRETDTALIIGYTKGKGDRSALFGSLHLAKLENDKLVYYGKVGTGFDKTKMKKIYKILSTIKTVKKPIPDSIEEERDTIWLAPEYSCNIRYASMTSNNTYREPVYIDMKKI